MIRYPVVTHQRCGEAYIMRRLRSLTGAPRRAMRDVNGYYSSAMRPGAARKRLNGSVDSEVRVVVGRLDLAGAQLTYLPYERRDALRQQSTLRRHSS